MKLPSPQRHPRPQASDYHRAIRLGFTLRSGQARLTYNSRMDDDAPLRELGVAKLEQTISGYADNLVVKKIRGAEADHSLEAQQFFSGKQIFAHIAESPKDEVNAGWPYSIVLNLIQGEYTPMFQWRIDDRSLFTRLSVALIQDSKITFEVRLRDTDPFFRDLRLLDCRDTLVVLPLYGINFWI